MVGLSGFSGGPLSSEGYAGSIVCATKAGYHKSTRSIFFVSRDTASASTVRCESLSASVTGIDKL